MVDHFTELAGQISPVNPRGYMVLLTVSLDRIWRGAFSPSRLEQLVVFFDDQPSPLCMRVDRFGAGKSLTREPGLTMRPAGLFRKNYQVTGTADCDGLYALVRGKADRDGPFQDHQSLLDFLRRSGILR